MHISKKIRCLDNLLSFCKETYAKSYNCMGNYYLLIIFDQRSKSKLSQFYVNKQELNRVMKLFYTDFVSQSEFFRVRAEGQFAGF